MDVRRHTTAGRLSELFGSDTLEIDEFMRTLGWRHVAEQELPLLQPQTRAALDAYAVGRQRLPRVPQPVADRRAVHRARPRRPRLPARTVDRGRLAGLAQGDGVGPQGQPRRGDRARPGVRRPHAGPGRRALPGLRLPGPRGRSSARARWSTASSSRTRGGRYPQPPATGVHRRPARPARRPATARSTGCRRSSAGGDGVGSNSWVVDGEHSETGAPLLANDPHLGVSVPGHLDADGAALPRGQRRRARSTSPASPSPACPA